MATDTAFAVALIAMMGQRVPVELRIFLTAAAIVDDIGAIIVVAFFYSSALDFAYLGAAAAVVLVLAWLNRSSVYRVTPYLLLGVALWVCVHVGRPARDARGRVARRVHPDAAAADTARS